MIWAVLAFMTVLAAASVIAPIMMRRSQEADIRSGSVAFYQAQIAEIARDQAMGLLAPDEADVARAEAGRRLLNAAKLTEQPPLEQRRNGVMALALALFVAVFSGALYYKLGQPMLPDAPLQARLDKAAPENDVAVAVARIEKHLADNPGDGRGWEVVAPVYLKLGRGEDARRAFGESIRLNGESADRLASLGEASVYLADGKVDAAARKAFERAFALDPKLPKARYYLGLAAEQDGDVARATEIWSALVDDAPSDGPMRAALRQRIAQLKGQAAPLASPTAKPPEATASGQRPNAAAIAAMKASDRDVAIRSMVDGLAARLKQQPDDVDGWLRLVRAYAVLKERDKATNALGDARKIFAANPEAGARLNALAGELGLEG